MWSMPGSTRSSTYFPSPVNSVGSSRRRTAFPRIEPDAAIRHPSHKDERTLAAASVAGLGFVEELLQLGVKVIRRLLDRPARRAAALLADGRLERLTDDE